MRSLTAIPDSPFLSPANPHVRLHRYRLLHDPDDRPVIIWGKVMSPLGPCLVAAKDGSLCHLGFINGTIINGTGINGTPLPDALAELRRDGWAGSSIHEAASPAERDALATLAERIFEHGGSDPVDVVVKATDFQWSVWKGLLGIASGSVSTYEALAERIGSPDSARAVGNAVGKNPVAWLVPCHRVVPKNGGTGGYRWGVELKEKLLAAERLSGVYSGLVSIQA